jgi:glucokinase
VGSGAGVGLTIGVDVGGTKVAAGVVDEDGRVLEQIRQASIVQRPGAAEEAIAESIRKLAAAYQVEAVGVGAAGLVDETRSIVRFTPNLGWREQPLRAILEEATGLPVVVENDANTAAWAEYRFGAARGRDDVVVITVGTGIGGALILGGQLYRGRFGLSGEVGHMVLDPDGPPCGCGRRGCFEQFASGNALVREARARAEREPEKAAILLALGDGTVEGIRGSAVMTAAQQGDPVALEAFGFAGYWLGRGIAEIAAVLDPGSYVIGGGVSEAGDLLLGPARQQFTAHLMGTDVRPHAAVIAAALGNEAGVVGAAELARLPH